MFGRPLVADDRRVLRMMARGERTKTIAAVLGVSPNAVSHRITNIGRKLGTLQPPQTLLEAYRRGLIGPPGPRVGLRVATVADRPGFVWWQHSCTALDAFAVGVSPAGAQCGCALSTGQPGEWRPVWVGEHPERRAAP
ncbi:hypothetical protein BBK82_05110 [Lentzea guizhouensis]|uniref:HTH luxR-type domain-containing protein n=1 Tax=Lentzea guizhouensis TaxID=1586287 RepID=A0A1B2HCW9_9PSEU|nr:hypothetical protein BBK82_05110 [Lentzea guizhouensis]